MIRITVDKSETVLLLITVSEVLFVDSVFPRSARTVAVRDNELVQRRRLYLNAKIQTHLAFGKQILPLYNLWRFLNAFKFINVLMTVFVNFR